MSNQRVTPELEPFFVTDGDTLVPNDIAQGGWGPTRAARWWAVCLPEASSRSVLTPN